MARECMVTGRGTARGNNVAHCNIKVRRSFKTNAHWKRIWFAAESRFVSLFISSRGLRTVDKVGIDLIVAELRARGEKV